MASVLPTVSIGGGSSAGGGASGNPRLAGGIVLPRTTIGQVTPQETLNRTSRSLSKQQAQIAAYNSVLPVWYGTPRQGARVVDAGVHGNRLVLFVVWGRGPHDALVQFAIGDAAPPAGVLAAHYDGTQVAPDPTLVAMYGGGYAEVLPGVSYSVIRVAAGEGAGWPQCAAIWRGRRVYDPRSDTTAWSSNPALWLADFLTNTTYGAGREVDWDSVTDTADACDALVGGQPRRGGGGLVLDTRQEIAAWIDTLRTYAGCWVIDEGAPVKLVPNRPRAPVFAFRHSEGNIIGMAPVRSARLADVPTVVEVRHTDTAQLPWRERSVFAPSNGLPAAGRGFRLQTVPLPGIQSASQATREAVERLNQQTLCELATELEAMAEGARIEPGDRVTVDWPAHGFADKEFLVTATRRDGWRYKLDLLETDLAMYSDAIVAESSTPDTALPNPSTPPAVAGLTLVEALVQYDDGRIESVIDANWPAVEWPYPVEYLVELIDGIKTLPVARTRNLRARTPALVEGGSYTVRVAVVGNGMYVGEPVGASLTIQGKLLLPGNVPSLSVFEIGGEVRGTIGAAFDKDMVGYEIRYGPVGCAWTLSATVKFVDFVNAAAGVGGYFVYRDAPAGTWDFLVCARDSIGQYSPVPARATVVVTLDVNSFLLGNHAFASPTLTGMAEYHLPGDPARYFVTDDGVPAATTFPGLASGYPAIAATYHAPQVSELVTEAWDIGLLSAGNWNGAIASEAISGAKGDVIRLSADGTTWADEGGLSAKANARFGKVKSSAAGTATLKVRMGDITLRVDAVPRVFEADVTTLASGVFTVTLPDACAKFKSLAFTPLGTSPCTWTFDNLVTGATPAFDLYAFNLAGAQIARAGKVRAETV